MAIFYITHRNLPAYRHSYLVTQKAWITTRTPLYYLDLAAPNEVLFKEHFKKVFPNNRVAIDLISSLTYVCKKQRFPLDDITVGCEGRKDSRLFYLYAMSTERNVDSIGLTLFTMFLGSLFANAMPLTSGEKAVRFLNLAALVDYPQLRKITLSTLPYDCDSFVDSIFNDVYPSVLKGIYKKRSEHPLLLKKFWDLFCITDKTQRALFVNVPDAEHLKFMLEVANRIQFDFWGFRYGVNRFTECIIFHYINDKKCDLVVLLLEYGFLLGEMLLGAPCRCSKPLTKVFLDYSSKELLHNRFMALFLVRSYETKRFLLDIPEFVELYQKLSRSLPLPSQPSSMALKALKHERSCFSSVEEMTVIHEATDVHPSDSNVVVPQKLSQLSRCVIRRTMSANYQLPTGISDSRLPTLLKRFLNLEF